MEGNLTQIYQIGNFIAAQASDDIKNVGQKLFDIFRTSFEIYSGASCSKILPLMWAIQDELTAFGEFAKNQGIHSETLADFTNRLKLLDSYESWESPDMFVNCAWIMFGLEWI